MARRIDIANLKSTIDRERDFDLYDLSLEPSFFDKRKAHLYRIYEGDALRTTACVFKADELLTPDLASLVERYHIFAVGARNTIRDIYDDRHFEDIVISLYSCDGCHIHLGKDAFMLKTIDEIARIIVFGSGPYYKVSIRNSSALDPKPHKCEIVKTDDEYGFGIVYTDSSSIKTLCKHISDTMQ